MPKSKSQVHRTPDKIFDIILTRWNIPRLTFFDPCPVNPEFDGLNIPWKEWNFVNPPWDVKLLSAFVDKAIEEMTITHNSIMLLPSKTDQEWFHKIIEREYDIEWIKGRVRFMGEESHSPQPCFLVKIAP